MVDLHGYSERGLVNALFESIAASDNANDLWAELMDGARYWIDAYYGRPARSPELQRSIKRLQIYVEPSLSRYGNPDAVVLVDYENKSGPPTAFFIEAKRETFTASVGSQGLEENSSSILHELFLKARFDELSNMPNGHLNNGVKIYNKDKNPRTIGSDPMVLELARALKDRLAYFVSLTSDPTPPVGAPWPPALQQIPQKMLKIDTSNAKAHPGVTYGDPRVGWIECSLQLGWDEVYKWASTHQLTRILSTLEENRTKFSLQPIASSSPPPWVEKFFNSACGLVSDIQQSEQSSEKQPVWNLRDPQNKVVATYRVGQGLDGDPWVSIYFSPKHTGLSGTGLLRKAEVDELTLMGSVDLHALHTKATTVGWAP